MANENTWHSRQANGKEMEWMWISRCVLHPKQLVFSTDVSFKEPFAPSNECARSTALENSWVPILPQGESKSHPALEAGSLKPSCTSAFAEMSSKLVMAFRYRQMSPRTWAGTTNLSHVDHKITITF